MTTKDQLLPLQDVLAIARKMKATAEDCSPHPRYSDSMIAFRSECIPANVIAVVDALAALAQQAQEPVAWMWRKKDSGTRGVYFEEPASFGLLGSPEYEWTMLYTAPPAPQPAPLATPKATLMTEHRDYIDGYTAGLADGQRLAPLAGEVTDEQIIAIKKASKAEDPTKPWGDTLAFARAILALRPQAVPMTDEQRALIIGRAADKTADRSAAALYAICETERLYGITAKAEGEG